MVSFEQNMTNQFYHRLCRYSEDRNRFNLGNLNSLDLDSNITLLLAEKINVYISRLTNLERLHISLNETNFQVECFSNVNIGVIIEASIGKMTKL